MKTSKSSDGVAVFSVLVEKKSKKNVAQRSSKGWVVIWKGHGFTLFGCLFLGNSYNLFIDLFWKCDCASL